MFWVCPRPGPLGCSQRSARVAGLRSFSSSSGIDTLRYYARMIMRSTGLGASNSIVCSVIIGAVNLGMTRVLAAARRPPVAPFAAHGLAARDGISVALLGVSLLADPSSVVLLV